MPLVPNMAIAAGILNAEELEAVVIFLAAACHRGEFVPPAAVECGSRRRAAVVSGAPAAPSATPLTAAVGRASRGDRTLAAGISRPCRAPPVATSASSSTATTTSFAAIPITVFRSFR
jgi:hypothetical protein